MLEIFYIPKGETSSKSKSRNTSKEFFFHVEILQLLSLMSFRIILVSFHSKQGDYDAGSVQELEKNKNNLVMRIEVNDNKRK